MSSCRATNAKAIDRIIAGHSPQRIPADMTDPDIVLTDCKAALDAADARVRELEAELRSIAERQR